MNGILLVDKPSGWTSHDVVAKVRSILRTEISKQELGNSSKKLIPNSKIPIPKVGHTGTLDPMATGLLILVIGNYTKKAQEFSKLDKTYEAEVKLGENSSTGDEEGEKTKISNKKPEIEEVKEVLKSFVGEMEQVPPAYSAIKVGGKRAYKLARAGQKVEIEPRKVKIYSIEKIEYKYPYISFTTKVSSGTYIRSLAEDIGQKLGTGAYLSSLRRTHVGKFSINDAIPMAKVEYNKLRKEVV